MKRIIGFAAIVFILLFSCGKARPAKTEDKKPAGINKEYTSGPLAFTVKTDKSEITIAEKLSLTLTATIDKKYQVKMPEPGGKIDEFTIKDFTNGTPKLAAKDKMVYTQSYVLDPFLSGEYTLPAFTVKFWAEGDDQNNPHVLESEPIKIKVNSILPDNLKELKVKDIIGPLAPPPPDLRLFFIVLGAVVVVGGGAAWLIVWYVRKRQAETRIVTIPAHELAYRQLRKLVAENLIEKGEARLFYFRISDILRHYIENRFNLHAPEQTTEEFLADLKKLAVLGEQQKRLLKLFLEYCDLVKFAKHEPQAADIQKTFDTCKEFISVTESIEARIRDDGQSEAEEAAAEGL